MMEKKFPPSPEKSSLRITNSAPPSPLSTDSRFSQGEASKVLLKTQSLRIENSELPALPSTNSRFSRGEENKKPPRHSKITQPLRIENSKPPALSSVNSRFS